MTGERRTPYSGRRSRTPATASGLGDALPLDALSLARMRAIGGVEIAHLRQRAGEIALQPLEGTYVALHTSGPTRLVNRFGARRDDGVAVRSDIGIYAGQIGGVQAANVGFKELGMLLEEAYLRRVAQEAGADPERFEVLDRFKARDPVMERLMLSFLPELESGGLGGELYGEGLAQALAVHLMREHSSLGRGAKRRIAREPKGALAGRQLKAATDFIGDNLGSGLALGEIAKAANLSPYHFSRLFKESTGLSPHRYVIRERVEKAKNLLLQTDLPVGEVARLCGFSHQSHLARHARRLLGVAPTDLRR